MPSWTAAFCALFIKRRTSWEHPLICHRLTLSTICKNSSTSVLLNGPQPCKNWSPCDNQAWLKEGTGISGRNTTKTRRDGEKPHYKRHRPAQVHMELSAVLGLPTFTAPHHPPWADFCSLQMLPLRCCLAEGPFTKWKWSLPTAFPATSRSKGSSKTQGFNPKRLSGSWWFPPCSKWCKSPPKRGEKEQGFCTQAGRKSPQRQVSD